MAKIEALDDARYTAIGARHGSHRIADESSRAAARWRRDVAVLARYGHGQAMLDSFLQLNDEHKTLREKRPEAVAAKETVIRERNEAIQSARHWVRQVESLLGVPARKDAALATKLNAALPADDSALGSAVGALSNLLRELGTSLPEDAGVPALITEGGELGAALGTAPGTVAAARTAKLNDTAEIDLLDGKLYIAMRELNRAGRRAVRAGKLQAPLTEYRFTPTGGGSPPGPAQPAGAGS